jgi:hypothetical protein
MPSVIVLRSFLHLLRIILCAPSCFLLSLPFFLIRVRRLILSPSPSSLPLSLQQPRSNRSTLLRSHCALQDDCTSCVQTTALCCPRNRYWISCARAMPSGSRLWGQVVPMPNLQTSYFPAVFTLRNESQAMPFVIAVQIDVSHFVTIAGDASVRSGSFSFETCIALVLLFLHIPTPPPPSSAFCSLLTWCLSASTHTALSPLRNALCILGASSGRASACPSAAMIPICFLKHAIPT